MQTNRTLEPGFKQVQRRRMSFEVRWIGHSEHLLQDFTSAIALDAQKCNDKTRGLYTIPSSRPFIGFSGPSWVNGRAWATPALPRIGRSSCGPTVRASGAAERISQGARKARWVSPTPQLYESICTAT